MDDQGQATRTLRGLLAQLQNRPSPRISTIDLTQPDSINNQRPSIGYSQPLRHNAPHIIDLISGDGNFQKNFGNMSNSPGHKTTVGYPREAVRPQTNIVSPLFNSSQPVQNISKSESHDNELLLFETKRIRRTRSVIPNSVKDEIGKLAEDNPRITQGEIAQIFGIDRTTVSKILKRKKMFHDDGTPYPCVKISRPENQISLELEEALFSWYVQMKELNIMVTQSMLIETAESMANEFGIVGFIFDKRWLTAFLERHMDKVKTVVTSNIKFGKTILIL